MIEYSAERRNNALNEFITPRELRLGVSFTGYMSRLTSMGEQTRSVW